MDQVRDSTDNRQDFGNFDGMVDIGRGRSIFPALLAVLFRSEGDRRK
jgi:hypothetical protein